MDDQEVQQMLTDRSYRTIDLFAGAGGLTLGFEQANLGFEPIFAVEFDEAAARTYKQNFGCEVIDQPIEKVNAFPEAEVILGGPPCQGFSPLGRDRDEKSRGELNALWVHFLRAVRQVRPLAFVIENVPQFHKSTQFAKFCQFMTQDPVLKGYGYNYGVLNAADYGVAQTRKRGILMAVRSMGMVPWPPEPSHGPDAGTPYRTVRDEIDDLPLNTDGFTIRYDGRGNQVLHFGRRPLSTSVERYRAIPEGGNRFDLAANRPDLLPRCWANKPTGTTDVMGRLWWDRPAFTIRTEFFKPEKGRYLHPEADRPITHREAARLQSFPDAFVFEGSKTAVARQIGNAVPPRLAKAIARHLHMLMENP